MSYPADFSSRHLKIPFRPCSLIPRKPLPCQNEGDLAWISENKASNNALGQTPTSLRNFGTEASSSLQISSQRSQWADHGQVSCEVADQI